jgi:hypothetical protein
VLGRQEQEADGLVVRHVRQAGFQRAARGAAASGVTVEREDHGVGLAQQLLHMNWRAGRAKRGDGIGKPELGQRDHIHVAFYHQHVAIFADCVTRLEQTVELRSLAEERRFRGIQVLWLALPHHAAAKPDHIALRIADREHDAIAEAVVAARLAIGVALVLGLDQQPGLHQRAGDGVIAIASEHGLSPCQSSGA